MAVALLSCVSYMPVRQVAHVCVSRACGCWYHVYRSAQAHLCGDDAVVALHDAEGCLALHCR